MAEIYMYADETGDLDMSGSPGASRYFGFGTAVFVGDHGHALWEGLQLRCRLERRGVSVPQGLHAKNDSHTTRGEVFDLIRAQAPRFDTTFLAKENAYSYVRAAGQMRLYKLAWYLHFKEIVRRVSSPGDTVYVVAASLNTNKKEGSARDALEDVCRQSATDREIVLCVWNAPTSWGVQVADYGLWAVQRVLEDRKCPWYESSIEPTLATTFRPWGLAK
ncbi:DUF3800 domain-containing protein [Streptomyces sp. NRRL F-2747]|uniref:DUF3800 domain-containing protein n=1 Tax=Streptomyces sp. NRRL F-2747 TaxID=1463843 RepID=UPI001F242095|nr:DUF3800 domain-containing protein [Streptomyces sp. NRRL F-2747]